ncbi:MAG: chemotaxis protein CheA [Chloroflexi bacterium]|nr:chemotaxis protein CheA [Chloroflexota bacterium]
MIMETMLTFEIEADELEIFLQDVNEHLEILEAGILRLEQASDTDTLNASFRAAHTIKAVAATVGHSQMTTMTHTLETIFDAMRQGEVSPTQNMTDELLATVDVLKAMRDEVVTLKPSGIDATVFLERLYALIKNDDGEAEQKDSVLSKPSLLTPEQTAQVQDFYEQEHNVLEIHITTRPDAFAQGARLLQATVALAELGNIVTQQPSETDLTSGQHSGHLWLILATRTDTEIIKEALEYITDLKEFRIQPYDSTGAMSSISSQVSADTLADIPTPISLKDQDLPAVDVVRQVDQQTTQPGPSQSVRISVERLDTLMNLVGELVTDRTRLIQVRDVLHAQYGKDGTINALSDMATHFDRIVDQLQEEVMQARMLPVEHLFSKFPRLVRDLARTSNKQVNLIIEGEATELDRSVIEMIGDPLIHLLRNAVDHGIELPQKRIAAGKPPAGTIWLTAVHEEGHIVITVQDDGRGIDPKQIRQSAVSRGLMSEDEAAQLDDDAATSLIFQPNLSTAKQITDVSGRGVGLDVVRANVKRLSGSVMVESEMGSSTTFRLTLPLTLAIVQAMMVALKDDVYAIPLTSVVETLYLSEATIHSVKGRPVIKWRDQVLPIVHLRQFFAHHRMSDTPPNEKMQAVVTVVWGKLKAGLVVDKLIGKQEVVIKSLGSFIGNVPGLSGCTILGDGRIALIVDVPGLISTTMKRE